MSALDIQVGGNHYKDAKIQPVEYAEANGLLFLEACVIKRLTRHNKPTGKGRQDIEKAIHELQLLLELRYPLASAEFGKQHMIEPAAAIDDDSPRQQAVQQNGNDGAVYAELAELAIKMGNKPIDGTKIFYDPNKCLVCGDMHGHGLPCTKMMPCSFSPYVHGISAFRCPECTAEHCACTAR